MPSFDHIKNYIFKDLKIKCIFEHSEIKACLAKYTRKFMGSRSFYGSRHRISIGHLDNSLENLNQCLEKALLQKNAALALSSRKGSSALKQAQRRKEQAKKPTVRCLAPAKYIIAVQLGKKLIFCTRARKVFFSEIIFLKYVLFSAVFVGNSCQVKVQRSPFDMQC